MLFLKDDEKSTDSKPRYNADTQQTSVIFKEIWCSKIGSLSLNKAYYEEPCSDMTAPLRIMRINIGIDRITVNV